MYKTLSRPYHICKNSKNFRDCNCLYLDGRLSQCIEVSAVTSCPYQQAHICGLLVKRFPSNDRLELGKAADWVNFIMLLFLVNFCFKKAILILITKNPPNHTIKHVITVHLCKPISDVSMKSSIFLQLLFCPTGIIWRSVKLWACW
jgi:hypothetical protein